MVEHVLTSDAWALSPSQVHALLERRSGRLGRLVEDASDVIQGRQCLSCRAPGRPMCTACCVGVVSPHRHDTGHWVAGAYDGHLRSAILGFKEHGCLALGAPLGSMLAIAVLSLLASAKSGPCIRLVPVPSHRRSRRDRGFDAVGRLAGRAAQAVSGAGLDASVSHALVLARDYERHSAGSVAGRSSAAGAFRGEPAAASGAGLVIVDDVITTGGTVREAHRALVAAGVTPIGAAAVAGTVRRTRSAPHRSRSAPA